MVNPEKSMTKIHKTRLRKLIAFLRKLPRKKFDFGDVRYEDKCGTVACAIGWTPEVFPRLVTTGDSGCSLELDGKRRHFADIAEGIFGIPWRYADYIFQPNTQDMVNIKLKPCDSDATPKQVAKMLEKFLALVDAGEIDFDKWRAAR